MNYRKEIDSLGEVTVPIDVLYGAQTTRAIENFTITQHSTHPQMIKAIGMVKKAAAIANHQSGYLDKERLSFIVQACDEVIEGGLNQYFVTDVIQGGAGTSVNMNANEVIANRASQLANKPIGIYDYIHPNDHVNFGQSTNDVFPTSGKLAALFLVHELLDELEQLRKAVYDKSKEFSRILKMGRTHLQDAVPIKLGQEFHAYATSFTRDLKRINSAFDDLKSVNMGATAVGTGINTDENYKKIIVPTLSEICGIKLSSSKDLVDGTRNVDTLVWASSSLKTFGVNLSKMCNDLRLMASGPKAGFFEISFPERQPGSSIMPGKVNPVIAEVSNQVAFNVFGNDVTILKAAEAGQLELNVFEPVIFYNLFQSIETLTNACRTLRLNAIEGLVANRDQIKHLVESSVGSVTALAPHIGYENASKIAKQTLKQNRKLIEIILESGLLSKEDIDIILDIDAMTKPGIPGKKLLRRKEKKAK